MGFKIPEVWTVDFESKAILPRPYYPPEPVGCSVMGPDKRRSHYLAWGHPAENNCTLAQAKRELRDIWNSGALLLFHNSKFDLDVAETHLGLKMPDWRRVHDTLFLLFLKDPHAASHSLKPSAERELGMKPEEQEAVRDWLMAHQQDLRSDGLLPSDVELSLSTSAKPSPSGHPRYWAAYICLAPGGLVGKYADGDVVRTLKLFKKVLPEIHGMDMMEAYDRERQLMPVLLENERQGVRADLPALEISCAQYEKAMVSVDAWLRRQLKVKDLNVDSDRDLAQALIKSGKADEELFRRTDPSHAHPEGQLSASKDSLLGAVTDRKVMNVLQYRSMLQTRLGTFLQPWRDEARSTGGLVHPNWNQVRQPASKGNKGARTGRLSASRFMNAPASVGTSQHDSMATVAYRHPSYVKGLPELPAVRVFLLPDAGQIWCKRDYAQQELRILAHFEDNVLLKAYQENPRLDMHTYATELVERDFGVQVGRTRMKTIGFSLLYGMGLGELASRLEMEVKDAKDLKTAYLSIFPGLKTLQNDLSRMGKSGEPLRTWGGRLYYAEEPKLVKGRMRTFEYKLLNYLIQGSAADCTKQALINYAQVRKDGRFLITVHDEINFSAEEGRIKSEMKRLSDAMADVAFDVPMLSDGKTGPNWGSLQKYAD